MIIRIFILILSIVSVKIYSQSIEYKLNDITNNKLSLEKENQYLYNLNPINQTSGSIHFRIIYNRQIIDLIRTNRNQFSGSILNRITQFNYKKKNKNELKDKYEFFQRNEIDSVKAKEIVNKLLISKQYNLPSDSLIPNWNSNFLHCNTTYYQIKIENNVKNQKYDCIYGQDSTNVINKTLIDNNRLITKSLKLDSIYSSFTNKLPKGKSYSYDGYRVMYILTEKQNKDWIKSKPIRDYLKSKKDSVDNYLNLIIKQINIKNEKFNCFETYHLTFTKEGKLKKIKVADYNKPSLKKSLGLKDYFEDVREIKKCKKVIKTIFGDNDLKFLNLKYSINRSIDFDLDGNAQLHDNTIY